MVRGLGFPLIAASVLICLGILYPAGQGLSLAAQGGAFEEIKAENVDGVVIPPDKAREFYYNSRVIGYFTPSREDILKAEGGLMKYIQETISPGLDYPFVPDPDKKLANYKRQYVGVVFDDGYKIWLNCFCSAHNDSWKRSVVSMIGGGACYFNVLYDINSGKFSHLVINSVR